jgi:hypothetical protein
MDEKDLNLTKANDIQKYREQHTEPYFDLTRTGQLGQYAAYYVDKYRKDSKNEQEVLRWLRLIFSPDFEYYLKIVNGKRFCVAFSSKIRAKKRLDTFKYLLSKINDKYNDFDYS